MLSYYKFRTEISNEFGVSEGAVRNWIKKALAEEIDLELTEVNSKKLILKNQKNYNLMKALAEEGKKYKSLEDREVVLVDETAYNHLDKNQVIDVLDSLESSKSIPHKYFYLNGGADYWEDFYKTSLKDSQYTTSHSDLYYFENCYHLIKDNFHKFEKINIVDIGQGNGEPVLGLLKKIISRRNFKLLHSYRYKSKDVRLCQKTHL